MGKALLGFFCKGGGSPFSEASLISRVVGSWIHMRVTHGSQSTTMIDWKWAARIQFIETSALTVVRFILEGLDVTQDVRALCVFSSKNHQFLEGSIISLDSHGLFSITRCGSDVMELKRSFLLQVLISEI